MRHTYFLSVLRRVDAPGPIAIVLSVLSVTLDTAATEPPGIAWVRQHADEIATAHLGADYCALMVEDTHPVPEYRRELQACHG
jgi:hypothetical protein